MRSQRSKTTRSMRSKTELHAFWRERTDQVLGPHAVRHKHFRAALDAALLIFNGPDHPLSSHPPFPRPSGVAGSSSPFSPFFPLARRQKVQRCDVSSLSADTPPSWASGTITSTVSTYYSPVGRASVLRRMKIEQEAQHKEFLQQMAAIDAPSLSTLPPSQLPTRLEPTTTGPSTPLPAHNGSDITFGNVCDSPRSPPSFFSLCDSTPAGLVSLSEGSTDYGSPLPAPPLAAADLDALFNFDAFRKACAASKERDVSILARCAAIDAEESSSSPYTGEFTPSWLCSGSYSDGYLDIPEASVFSVGSDWDVVSEDEAMDSGILLQQKLCGLEQRWGRLPTDVPAIYLAIDCAATRLLMKHSLSFAGAFASSDRSGCNPLPFTPSPYIPELPYAELQNSSPEASALSQVPVAESQNSSLAAFAPLPEIDLGTAVRAHMRQYSCRQEPIFTATTASVNMPETPSRPRKTSWMWKATAAVAVSAAAGLAYAACCAWF
ncbi:hypothetical protein BKA67DRAFT_531087 [Truncatella angustata]|uniref:Uncharacterized protein n=1 Tax=Truncatella angustata TaxID=152316 RepID=A0A9P9A5N0_9PEZI|nr:uncharacterized protein BKA67DRAFT_531087 [Truncatella angustata]KAH6661009.1 hypothetical protein BKA67DRAFT_531087 [Truncatella angustata]KAH8203719.1 hypothetical protein TruAng_002132 [Truncatella angustata]